MQQKVPDIDICVLTYKRPDLLQKLIESILNQDFLKVKIKQIVFIDNDKNKSAQNTIECMAKTTKIPFVYEVEPEQNIALARNRALSKVTSKYFAFVDDDESVSRNWIDNLYSTMNEYDADIVFGPTVSVFPTNAPLWMKGRGFFERKRYGTGTIRPYGASGNVLIKQSEKTNQIFDCKFGLSGGEDTDFFLRVKLKGAKLVWCDSAIVFETIASNRLNVLWLVKRGYREGIMYSKILSPTWNAWQAVVWFLKRIIYLASSILLLPVSIFVKRHYRAKVLIIFARNVGQLIGITKISYSIYKTQNEQ